MIPRSRPYAPRRASYTRAVFTGLALIILGITFGTLLTRRTSYTLSVPFYPPTSDGYPLSPIHDVNNFYARPFLDRTFTPRRKIDIVMSMYREDSLAAGASIRQLRESTAFKDHDVNVIVYCKDKIRDLSKVKERSNADRVELLPNVGREAATYLHHILANWDDLAEHTLFIQAEVHDVELVVKRIEEFYVPATGMLGLGFGYNTCDCLECSEPTSEGTVWSRIPQIYSAVYGELCPTERHILLGYQGQFLVSAKRIRGTSKRVYSHLQKLLEADQEHWIHNDEHAESFDDRPSEPYFGHQMERSWMVLFQCADDRLYSTCNRLVGRRTDEMGDDACQCLDPENVEPLK